MYRVTYTALACLLLGSLSAQAEVPPPLGFERVQVDELNTLQKVWLDDDLLAEGWIQLTGSKELFGWTSTNGTPWNVCSGADAFLFDEGEYWLMSNTEWGDFELIVDFSIRGKNCNSGVFIRSADVPTDPTKDCYEINIAPPTNGYPTGSLVGRQRGEYSEGQLKTLDKLYATHRLHIIAEGGHIQAKLDGKVVTDYTDPNPIPKGRIGLQHKEGNVLFKRVLLKPLGEKSIFNGKDLTGWKTDLAGPAKISVTDAGEMQILGGSGQVESEGEYGDFVMQFECKVNGDGANSGVFFRSIPGDKMNGYECQIQNSYLDGDRTKPKDCGTGGIYRRVNARLVNAKDHEWFYVTLNANGPHYAVWVNGIQVTDWTDTREPDENPRRGLRLKPGTFCLQAHDPTTDLLFRNLRVAELP
ncbi:DUF1080 domain-containing protein [Aeoliella sp. ICT_H6.2]|uniref:DUF1080 domain-containing protein n=1 Tax=Aeoliella straminimaris TaxID=2954799 RepID=A0A9X2FJS4_9BACT|nr:DUF1080 domain-containing protein [Aeoliella straminimaris]MCO6047821.1 DUF1080 domain-containing protein [Aeoliella straminimaris]